MTSPSQGQHPTNTTKTSSTPRASAQSISIATVRPRATGYPGYSETLPRTEQHAPLARRLAVTACATWGLPDEVAQAASLVMAELFSNAVRHARSPSVRVIVDRPTEDLVYVAVVDRAPSRMPELRTPGPVDVTGRGLLLVDDFADRWGYDLLGPHLRPWGKRVWAHLRATP